MADDHPNFASLVEVMHRLRSPGGCPWDAEQTHQTLRPYLLEETYEVLEALDGDSDEDLRDELGDLLLQVVFHSELATERGAFSVEDVAGSIRDKLIRRHPHVFADAKVDSSEQVKRNWARIKAEEKARTGGEPDTDKPTELLEGVPRALPALLRAHKLGERAARRGFDWPDAQGPLDKIHEELGEIAAASSGGTEQEVAAELGDLLLAVASYCRLLGHNAETVLERSIATFENRFAAVEREFQDGGKLLVDATPEELDAAWRRAKASVNGRRG